MSNDLSALQREIEILKGQIAGLDLTFAALAGFLNSLPSLPPSFVAAALDSAADTAVQLCLAKSERAPELPHALEHIEMLRSMIADAPAQPASLHRRS